MSSAKKYEVDIQNCAVQGYNVWLKRLADNQLHGFWFREKNEADEFKRNIELVNFAECDAIDRMFGGESPAAVLGSNWQLSSLHRAADAVE